ncbi:ephrin type-B receptor 5-like [Platysternon megacephalum]|uniref:Ephrin type-B receptor 5-like n=1 Tax=Platysternon megacephalum TaxID=55544 RepID=A0A4D9DV62_9SAUR|nr:ephrin type-B receptor 5-like [Platysternon megacephalum]
MLHKLEAGGEHLMGKGDVITLRGWDLGGTEANAPGTRREALPDAPATVTVPPEPSEIHSSLRLPLGQCCLKFSAWATHRAAGYSCQRTARVAGSSPTAGSAERECLAKTLLSARSLHSIYCTGRPVPL